MLFKIKYRCCSSTVAKWSSVCLILNVNIIQALPGLQYEQHQPPELRKDTQNVSGAKWVFYSFTVFIVIFRSSRPCISSQRSYQSGKWVVIAGRPEGPRLSGVPHG